MTPCPVGQCWHPALFRLRLGNEMCEDDVLVLCLSHMWRVRREAKRNTAAGKRELGLPVPYTLPLRDRLIWHLDNLSHKYVPDGTWLARLTCDAYDLNLAGMEAEDFLANGGKVPSRLAYWIAGVPR